MWCRTMRFWTFIILVLWLRCAEGSSDRFCSVVAAPALIGSSIETQDSVTRRLSDFLMAENATSLDVSFRAMELHALTSVGGILDSWSQPISRWAKCDSGGCDDDGNAVGHAEVARSALVRFVSYWAPACHALPFSATQSTFVAVATPESGMSNPSSVLTGNSTSGANNPTNATAGERAVGIAALILIAACMAIA